MVVAADVIGAFIWIILFFLLSIIFWEIMELLALNDLYKVQADN